MSCKSSTEIPAPFNFKADFFVRCLEDGFSVEIEVDQSILKIENSGSNILASFEALVIMTEKLNPNNRAIIHFDLRQLELSNLEKRFRCSPLDEEVTIEKITSEDEEVRRRFYDIIEDSMTEFSLHVYVAD